MASSGSIFSQTLQEITTTKLQELSKKRTAFEQLKAAAISNADHEDDPIKMLNVLSEGTMTCFGIRSKEGAIISGSSQYLKLETELQNLSRFADQARFDPSVSATVIRKWRESLINHMDVQSLRYQYADLYGQLTMEWLSSSQKDDAKRPIHPKTPTSADSEDDEFEEVSVKAKLEARQTWERLAFEAATVDQAAITTLLNRLFEDDTAQSALKTLREGIAEIENELASRDQFSHHSLSWTIKGLLSSDLLTNEKRGVLRDFLANPTILTELCDVLNMRIAALESWSWGAEVTVEARRELNGKFNVYMHEDLLQAIFLEYIGVTWSCGLKEKLNKFASGKDVWNTFQGQHSPVAKQRRAWFLGRQQTQYDTVNKIRARHYRAGYFVSQLLDSKERELNVEEGEVEADFMAFASVATKKKRVHAAQAMTRSGQVEGIYADEDMDEDESDEDMGFGLFDDVQPTEADLKAYKPANPMDARQMLLHLLSTEVLIKTRIDGEITAFRSQYNNWYQSLPHTTINTVLDYLGVSKTWLAFFQKFLEAPLRFIDEEGPPKLRKRGTPDAHILSDVLGESILFCLDFAVNKQTKNDVLWRMKDDIWFWSSSHETCVGVWKLIESFNNTMGVALDIRKSAAFRLGYNSGKLAPMKHDKVLPNGQIHWGMLYFDEKIGRFAIDRDMVDKHIEELRRQLKDKERSIFAWVQAYSTYASTFFTTNFGKLANCYGRDHLDAMLGMHERVQRTLFQGSTDKRVTSVVDWLKTQLEQRFGIGDIPDGYLFFPTELGGLDVKSPFISLLQFRDSVLDQPPALLDRFEQEERRSYDQAKKEYLEGEKWLYTRNEDKFMPQNPEEFMPFNEYIDFREDLNYAFSNSLVDVYQTLMRRPLEQSLGAAENADIMDALGRIKPSATGVSSITKWYGMEAYWRWVTMMYGPEILQRFGSFNIVDSDLLPMGMVSLFKSGRVSWQE